MEQTGLRWVVSRDGIEEASGPLLARGEGGSLNVKTGGVYLLQLVYIRVRGTIHKEGRVEFSSVAVEIL